MEKYKERGVIFLNLLVFRWVKVLASNFGMIYGMDINL